MEYTNLNQLITKASRIEQFIMKKEHKRANETGGLGPQLISVGTYNLAEEEMVEASMSAEIVTP